jgi:D-glycero-D-manno-heptose 1,7-bisphosphate phosphatase
VLTDPVLNPDTGEYESAHSLPELRLSAGAVPALRTLLSLDFELFVVSNQPSYAKGKVDLEVLQAIAVAVREQFHESGVTFRDTFYCFHHPQGIVPGYSGSCDCRKPSPYFLLQAAASHDLDLSRSWVVGDRDSDIACGLSAGCRTILIQHPTSRQHQVLGRADFVAGDVGAAVAIIAGHSDDTLHRPTLTGAKGASG